MTYAWSVFREVSRRRLLALLIAAGLLLLVGCRHDTQQSQAVTATDSAHPLGGSAPNTPPTFLRFPERGGAVEPWVQEQVELADAAHARVLVYVGASWCEPCKQFHQAVERGELNAALSGLRFLEFDQDRDAPALQAAGYSYQYIPVLALPDPDGRNHGRMISGSIKGTDAVRNNLVPRLQALLSGKVD